LTLNLWSVSADATTPPEKLLNADRCLRILDSAIHVAPLEHHSFFWGGIMLGRKWDCLSARLHKFCLKRQWHQINYGPKRNFARVVLKKTVPVLLANRFRAGQTEESMPDTSGVDFASV